MTSPPPSALLSGPSGGAFGNFDPNKYGLTPAPAAGGPAADVTGGAYTYDPNAGFLAHLHNLAVKMNNWQRAYEDAFTFGGLDVGQSALPGSPSLDQLRAQTQASRADIGPIASTAADVAGYATGPGELKIAGRTAERIAPTVGKWLGGALGGGAEGMLAGGTSTALHGGSAGDIERDIAIGGVGGALGGALGGVSGPPKGQWLDPAALPSTPALTATRRAAYDTLGQNIAFSGTDVTNAMNDVTSQIARKDIGGIGRKRASDTMDAIASIHDWAASPGAKTPADLAQLQSDLWDIHRAGARAGTPDAVYAPMVHDALDGVLANATPVGGTGAVGEAAKQVEAAKAAFKAEANSKLLDEMARKAAVPGGPTMPSQASSELLAEPKLYGQPGDVNYDALTRLAASDPGLANKFTVRHALGPLVEMGFGAGVGAAVPSAFGGDEKTPMWQRLFGGAIGGVAVPMAVHAGSAIPRQWAIDQAAQAARQAMTTPAGLPPEATSPLRDALRTLWFSRAATGQNPLNF